jgi:hypothetical protein
MVGLRRPYWRVKRLIDVVGALVLIVLLAPIMPLLALLVVFDVGFPVMFWQQRPGRGGRPFALLLRTMGAAHDADGRASPTASGCRHRPVLIAAASTRCAAGADGWPHVVRRPRRCRSISRRLAAGHYPGADWPAQVGRRHITAKDKAARCLYVKTPGGGRPGISRERC